MANIITSKSVSKEYWLQQVANAVTDLDELLQILCLEKNMLLHRGRDAKHLFSLRVPHQFISLMKKGDPNDPLLLQVITSYQEFDTSPEYSTDPLGEQNNAIPGLLHKYNNRALLIVKGGCAVNCRYCFRRHFPYQSNQGGRKNWEKAVDYISMHPNLDEVILSGGDPLMAKDRELQWLVEKIESVPHVKRLRIHSRLPIVIPDRITKELCQSLERSRLQIILVTHINHPQEISKALCDGIGRLRSAKVLILNQSVLLRNINDSIATLAELSNSLFDAGILPYYLHMLDRVKGSKHFFVPDGEACSLMKGLLARLSGYMVPKLVREVAGELSKIPINIE